MSGDADAVKVKRTPQQTEEAVREYLREHPDVIFGDPEFLAEIAPAAGYGGGSVVDLQQFVVSRLRGELDTLKSASRQIVETSRDNMALLGAVHRSIIDLIRARSAEEIGAVIATRIPFLLDVRAVVVAFEGFTPDQCAAFGGDVVIALKPGTVGEVFNADQDVILRSETPASATLFGEDAPAVNSDALVRLPAAEGLPDGLLAAGAEDAGHFDPELGTELLEFLALAVHAAISRWAKP